MSAVPVAGENGFYDLVLQANGGETISTSGMEIPPGFKGWCTVEVLGDITKPDTVETGIWMAKLKITLSRLGNGPVEIHAASAHLPGYDFKSPIAQDYVVVLGKVPGDAENICVTVSGGAEGQVADFSCRFFLSGTRP